MRLFIAITLSEEMKASATGAMHALKKAGVKGNYSPTANLHLTLAFIGEMENAAPVKEALQTVSYKPFRLSFSETGTFGDILWIGVKGNQGLNGLAKSIRKALDAFGIGYDKKAFSPHITLIRKMNGPWKSVPAPRGEMIVRKVSLMRSEVKGGRRVYTESCAV